MRPGAGEGDETEGVRMRHVFCVIFCPRPWDR
jgi:hypothetical protein